MDSMRAPSPARASASFGRTLSIVYWLHSYDLSRLWVVRLRPRTTFVLPLFRLCLKNTNCFFSLSSPLLPSVPLLHASAHGLGGLPVFLFRLLLRFAVVSMQVYKGPSSHVPRKSLMILLMRVLRFNEPSGQTAISFSFFIFLVYTTSIVAPPISRPRSPWHRWPAGPTLAWLPIAGGVGCCTAALKGHSRKLSCSATFRGAPRPVQSPA